MTNPDFFQLLKSPETISEQNITSIKQVIDDYPYFQSARAIYLKGLKLQDSFKYNHNLKVAAAYTQDRSVLFDFITSKEFYQNSISEYIKHNTEQLYHIKVDFEDISEQNKKEAQQFQDQLEASKATLDKDLFQEKNVTDSLEVINQKIDEPIHLEKKRYRKQFKIYFKNRTTFRV